MSNGAILKKTGKEFWIGSVNNQDGTIEEVHTYETAKSNDFHHSFYFSQPQLEKISDNVCSVFWIDDVVEGEFWRNEGREPWIIGKIYEQIELLDERKPKNIERPDKSFKVKNWKEWQKPFESKLNESPDYLVYKDKGVIRKVDSNTNQSVSFSLDHNKEKAVVNFVCGGCHGTMDREFTKRGLPEPTGSGVADFSGRLWLNHKMISFWFTPKDEKKLQKHLEELDQDLRDKGHIGPKETIFNSGWRVEDYRDDENEGAGKMTHKSMFDRSVHEPIPLEDFTYQEFNAQAYNTHLMNTREKENFYKKHGKPRGFGSDLKAKKNPIEWEQAKRLSESVDLEVVGSRVNIDNTPDYVKYLGLYSHDDDALSFIYDTKNNEWLFGDPGQGHGSIYTDDGDCIYDSDDWDNNGRLWWDSKVMIFWKYPTKAEFDDLLNELDYFAEFDRGDGWKVITVPNDKTDGWNWGRASKEKNIILVPIEEYKKEDAEDFSDKLLNIHIMNAKEKSKYYKKHGKPRGFGSDKTAWDSDNNIAWRQAKMKSEKMKNIKSFKLYENPDTLRYETDGKKVKLSFMSDDAITFGYIDGEMIVSAKGLGISHGQLCYRDRYGMKYPGRLWVNVKIITFWEYPPEKELKKVIKDIETQYNKGYVVGTKRDNENEKIIYEYEDKDKLKIDNSWKIEIVTNEEGEYVDPKTKDFNKKMLKVVGLVNDIVPLSNYTGSEKRSAAQLDMRHLEVGAGGDVPQGVGSRKKKTFNSWQKPFESIKTFDKFNKGYDR